jgi:hypothetical protein
MKGQPHARCFARWLIALVALTLGSSPVACNLACDTQFNFYTVHVQYPDGEPVTDAIVTAYVGSRATSCSGDYESLREYGNYCVVNDATPGISGTTTVAVVVEKGGYSTVSFNMKFKSSSCHVEKVSGGPENVVLYPVGEGHEAGG